MIMSIGFAQTKRPSNEHKPIDTVFRTPGAISPILLSSSINEKNDVTLIVIDGKIFKCNQAIINRIFAEKLKLNRLIKDTTSIAGIKYIYFYQKDTNQ